MKLMCHLFTTMNCNLNCGYCYVNANRTVSDNNNRLVEIANYLNGKDIMFIHIEGGEPLINDNIFSFLKTSKHNELTTIVTNATYITKEKLMQIRKYGVNKFIVSVDGLEQFHNKLRQSNCFSKVVEAIQLLVKLEFDVAISMTLVKENISQIKFVVEYFYNFGVKKFRFGDVLNLGRTERHSDTYCLDETHYRELLNEYLRIAENNDLNLNLSVKGLQKASLSGFEQFQINSYPCSNNGKQLSFLYNGDAYSCSNMMFYEDYFVGNICNTKVLEDFLTNSKHTKCIINCANHISIANC